MSTLDSRGREIVDSTPVELSVGLGQPPRLTLAQQIQRALMLQRIENNDEIRDDFDAAEDRADFGDPDVGPDDLIGPSPYEVPEDIPDFVSAAQLRDAARRQAEEKLHSSSEGNVSENSDSSN